MADTLASDYHPGQVVVVCGTNEKTRQALQEYPWPGEGTGVSVRILGFVANMDEWMSAADLLVTKVSAGSVCTWYLGLHYLIAVGTCVRPMGGLKQFIAIVACRYIAIRCVRV